MAMARRIVWGFLLLSLGGAVYGQHLVPIGDRVESPLLPAGISENEVHFNGQLAYLFKEDDGAEVVHVIGEFMLRLGKAEGQTLTSREAVVWITKRQHEGRGYHHFQIVLWQDAEVRELGRTITTGPVLFVTLNSFGAIALDVDHLARQRPPRNQVYQQGRKIRQAIAEGRLRGMDEETSMRVFDTSGLGSAPSKPARPPPLIHFQSEGSVEPAREVAGRQLIPVTGGAYLSRGIPGTGSFLEIRADSVVVFLLPSQPSASPRAPDVGLGKGPQAETTKEPEITPVEGRHPREALSDRPRMSLGLGDVAVEAVYLEGHVVMSQGPNMVRASRLYFDFTKDKALMLDAVVRSQVTARAIPLYVRAQEVRQLSENRFAASHAILTTSEFHTPHYHVGASRVELINRTPNKVSGRGGAIRAGSFRIHDATLNIGGTPIGYWPFLRGNIDTSETAIRGFRTGFSDEFGLELETKWQLFSVLGLETPPGFDAALKLDYFSKRGPGVGVDARYQRDKYFGTLRSYLLFDEDRDFLGRDRERQPVHNERGRFLLRHRQYLQDDWQLSLEVSYISDESFLEEFFESEFDNDKEQETLLYLKKQRDNWAFTALLQARILDFTTQTERLPDLGFFAVGRSLRGRAVGYSENRLGVVRYRPEDDPSLREFLRNGERDGSGSVGRVDSRQEVEAPVDVGPVRLIPFASVRGTAWDDAPDTGGLARVFGTYGVRGSMYLWRVYPDVRSSLFDIHGIRHVIKPDVTAWLSHTNRDSHELFPFDENVEGIDEVDGVTVGVRQRWQTKRGREKNFRNVDLLTFDVEAGFFNDAESDEITNGFTSFSRPENSVSQNFVNSSLIWRINDRTALLSEMNYDPGDGEVDVLNLSLSVERTPRLSYLLGYRFIEESNSNLLGFDLNYRLTEKHSLALRDRFDLARGQTVDFTVAFIRKFSHWFSSISFALDEAEDDFGVSFSLWPEGLPEATLGSRRFTGLATSTQLRGK